MEDFNMNKMEQEANQMTELNYLNRDNAIFTRTDGGFVQLEYNNEKWERVQILRLFPFTRPDEFISIRTVEEHAREIGVIRTLDDVTQKTRDILEEQLSLHYFMPVIKKIIDIKDEYGYAYFHVMTDRGECQFAINMGSNAVARLSETRLVISDLDENRFEIPDVLKLTQKEQRKLDLFL